ncbi:MAG TPA: ATP-dependent DNA helicase [Candidatus Saccharimonadales bacterium]|nr:ATP-dependent DNA helicase [Candidatus Saccharimonadales bacterium]
MNSFDKQYAKLNSRQRQAVDSINGPVLVIAGPGTGKTQLLSMRVANILLKSDIYPEGILCLTFTNKATDNMKQRLLNIIGEEAHSVAVKTFHGLAADIMNRFPEYFWKGAQLDIAADAIQLEVLQQILNNLPTEHPLALKFAGQFTLIREVSAAINLAKEAGLTPDKLRALIAANLAYLDIIEPIMADLGQITVSPKSLQQIDNIVAALPAQTVDKLITPLSSLQTIISDSHARASREYMNTGKTVAISKWKSRWLQKHDGQYAMFDERKRNLWWLAIADAYEQYRDRLHRRGYYDYADMLVEVIGQIEQREDLRASLQEQFQYVLIDEFQDTNAAQLRLAHLIADNVELDSPNIMAVGDDDQSIFKFQGAELSNMLGFTRQYPSAKTVVLTDNYRSTQAVLDSVKTIIEHASYRLVTERPDLSKKLVAVNSPKIKGLIETRSYRSRQEQLDNLADMAGQLLEKGSVAVLARHHSSLRDIAMLLHTKAIPIDYEQNNNILEQPVVEQLYIILKLIVHIKRGEISSVNQLLNQTLRHPMWGIKSERLWQFAVDQQKTYDWLSGLSASKQKQLSAIGAWLNWLVELSASEPLMVVVEYILGLRDNDLLDSPVRNYFFKSKMMAESYIETLSAVQLLRGLISEFRSIGVAKVETFVQFVDLMIENNKVISDTSPFVSGEHCVELLSVHKAKGLEFDTVIIIDTVESEWSPRSYGRIPPANLPLRPAEDDADDYVRLMYVAATRAKSTLIFGSFNTSPTGDNVPAAKSLNAIPITDQPASTGKELAQVLERTLLWPRLDQSNELRLLKPRLETYHLNVSNLINFLDVTRGGPQHFKERNLLRLPEAKTPSAAMGTAVHDALEEALLLHNASDFNIAKVLARFDQSLLDQGLPETDYQKRLTLGHRVLNRFMEKHNWEFSIGARPEYNITEILSNTAKIGGKLDVLDMTGENTIVQDYKTGRPLNSLSLTSGNDGVRAWRHKLQLMFYALLLKLDPGVKVKGEIIGQMIYVEADAKAKLTLTYLPTPDDLTRLASLVQAVWNCVMQLDLPDTSMYPQNLQGILQFEEDLLKNS